MTLVMVEFMTFSSCLFPTTIIMIRRTKVKNFKFKTMKIKLMPMFAGIISLAITALPAVAQPNFSGGKGPGMGPGMIELNLTQEQKNKMAEIHKNTRAEIDKILTQEQKDKFKAAMQNRQGMQAAFEAMNLSEDQKTKMQEIRETSRKQMQEVLTTEQKQKIREMMQQKMRNLDK